MQRAPIEAIPVSTLEAKFQQVFPFPLFNKIQSEAFHTILNSNNSVVISSPTGSGKTVIFELAIIKLFKDADWKKTENLTIIYVAPIKALCSERYLDWNLKFGPLGIKCVELTGDSDSTLSDYLLLLKRYKITIILTTPEKLDSLTRKSRDSSFTTSVFLFLIDEAHLLNENHRGPTLESVVSRMRTIRLFANARCPLRFVACSATIPNGVDIAEWLGCGGQRAHLFESGEEQRPVKLEKIILGYNVPSNSSLFKFDISLTYKIPDIISKHSHGKPTLVFCSTRKGVQQTAAYLAKTCLTRIAQPEVQTKLNEAANTLQDSKIREIVLKGVGFHHAGLGKNDRHIIEQLFLKGFLPILISTSTLALGVNLPAHLVIIKSTTQIGSRSSQEYSVAQVLQMIGRAGRPQFDESATAVIMTNANLVGYYEKMLKCGTPVESCLHLCLKEHLNAEITLGTITDISVAVQWLRTTFLFVRALKQPDKYGIRLPPRLNDQTKLRLEVEQYLFDLCLNELNALNQLGLIDMNMDDMSVSPTPTGRLMARYYITFDTMKLFSQISGQEDLSSLLDTLSNSSEFNDVQLRVDERKTLNQLNGKNTKSAIRFPLPGRVTSRQMKINCLIQASLGCLPIADPTLSLETNKLVRLAHRLSKCLVEYLWCLLDRTKDKKYAISLKNSFILSKCLHCGLWENSHLISKQIEGIGPVLSRSLAEAGYTTFESLGAAHPRDLEKILNRGAPFGSRLVNLFQQLPQYSIDIQQYPSHSSSALLDIRIFLVNRTCLQRSKLTIGESHAITFLASDAQNNVLLKIRLTDSELLDADSGIQFKLTVPRTAGSEELEFHIISESWIGLDVSSKFSPVYERGKAREIAIASLNKQKVKKLRTEGYCKAGQKQKSPESTPESIEWEDDYEDFEGRSNDLHLVNKIVDAREATNDDREKSGYCPPSSHKDVSVDFSNFTDWALLSSGEPTNAISEADQQLLGVLSDFESHVQASPEKPLVPAKKRKQVSWEVVSEDSPNILLSESVDKQEITSKDFAFDFLF